MPIRIVHWTTGNVGQPSVIAITRDPRFELVGCDAWSPDKVGRDVGDLCGLDSLGVTAPDDVDALIALRPDCVASCKGPVGDPTLLELKRAVEEGSDPGADWTIEHGHVMAVQGRPTAGTTMQFLPPPTSEPGRSQTSWCWITS
jgi:hypothetical protein